MIKHIVFWKIKEDLDFDGVFEEMKIRVEAMNGEIPGLKHVELGRDFNSSEVAYDVALYSELESKEALKVYQDHPRWCDIFGTLLSITEQSVLILLHFALSALYDLILAFVTVLITTNRFCFFYISQYNVLV